MALRGAAFWMVLTQTAHGWEITLWYLSHRARYSAANGRGLSTIKRFKTKNYQLLCPAKTSSGFGF
jgi:hypothetical protein